MGGLGVSGLIYQNFGEGLAIELEQKQKHKSIRGSWRDHFGGISGVLDTFRGL